MSKETLLSFIPVAHSLGLIAEYVMYYSGGRVAMFSGEISCLIQDMKDVRPSVLVTVPRLLDNIYNRICYSAKGNPIKSKLMERALESKRKEFDTNSFSEWSLLDTLVFKKAREGILGGKTKLIINGGGPLSPNVHELLRCTLKCIVSYDTTPYFWKIVQYFIRIFHMNILGIISQLFIRPPDFGLVWND